MDRGAWQATVHGGHKETLLSVCVPAHTHTHTHFNVYTRFLLVQTPCSINREILSLLIKEILYSHGRVNEHISIIIT